MKGRKESVPSVSDIVEGGLEWVGKVGWMGWVLEGQREGEVAPRKEGEHNPTLS